MLTFFFVDVIAAKYSNFRNKTDIHESKRLKRFEHIELPAKLLDYFLRSNKSNMNQFSNCLFLAMVYNCLRPHVQAWLSWSEQGTVNL